jgi:hypothetical protein
MRRVLGLVKPAMASTRAPAWAGKGSVRAARVPSAESALAFEPGGQFGIGDAAPVATEKRVGVLGKATLARRVEPLAERATGKRKGEDAGPVNWLRSEPDADQTTARALKVVPGLTMVATTVEASAETRAAVARPPTGEGKRVSWARAGAGLRAGLRAGAESRRRAREAARAWG